MEEVGENVLKFTKGCESVLSGLARHEKLSDLERQMVEYYLEEVKTNLHAPEVIRTQVLPMDFRATLLSDDTGPYPS